MASGTVKWFDPNRGYGFIRPEQGEDVFVHVSAVQASGLQTLQEGQAVEFDIEQGERGHRPPTCDHSRRTRRADRGSRLPLGARTPPTPPPGSASWSMPPEPVGDPGSLGVIADDPRRMRIRTRPLQVTGWWTGRAGGRDGDGRSGAAVRAAVAGLPGRPRPAPQLQGGHGVVLRLRPALAAG
jgi:CspA family cold shock protein